MSKPKSAADFDQAADRPDRPMPTNRISTPYAVVEAHGVPNPGVTVDQTNRKHELASDREGIAAGAIKPGEIGEDRSVSYEPGLESAARREAHVKTKREENRSDLRRAQKVLCQISVRQEPEVQAVLRETTKEPWPPKGRGSFSICAALPIVECCYAKRETDLRHRPTEFDPQRLSHPVLRHRYNLSI